MGAWNCSINGNDTAQDLIYEYRAAFYYNDVDTALEKIFDYVTKHLDTDEYTDFIYSLADFMWKKGILTEEVKNAAIKMIDLNCNMEIWALSGEKILAKRKKVLQEFKNKLLSKQPEKKKITLGLYMKSIFNEGDVITFKLNTKDLDCSDYRDIDINIVKNYDGKYVVLRKLYDHISYKSSVEPRVKDTWAVFQIVPCFFDELPSIDLLISLFNHDIQNKEMICTESSLYYFKKRNYELLGNIKDNLKDKYKHNYIEITSVYLGINKPWYHGDVEIIKKIMALKDHI